jgi:ferredoxin-nitrite reductase
MSANGPIDADPERDRAQKQYLQGVIAGIEARRAAAGLPSAFGAPAPPAPPAPDDPQRAAQDRTLAAGGKLTAEEQAKRAKNPLDRWDEFRDASEAGKFPKGTDVFLTKYLGLFYVAPAQDAFMCRLRFHGGIVSAHQLRGVAGIAAELGGGYIDVTTRANLQIREIKAEAAPDVLTRLYDLGIVNRGAGADNIRNVTGSPTAGIDPDELFDTRALCRDLHHHILNHRALYGLPRKFNIAFDGGGRIPVLEDTNDIGFAAVRVREGFGVPAGVYFRMELGGITGHGDFARGSGVHLLPGECVKASDAVVRVFIEHGDRTSRQKARLKYLLDKWGHEKFLAEAEKAFGRPWRKLPPEVIEPRKPADRLAHIGVFPQRQEGLFYIGVALPVGRLSAAQARAIAEIAERHGSGTIRLTVWQNLLVSDVPGAALDSAVAALKAAGLGCSASSIRAGLVACTGNTGCKFSATNTKGQALALADYLDPRVALEGPLNIHLTGCHHSCAQHYVGDIGLLGAKIEQGEEQVEEQVEGYHIYVGGGAAAAGEQAIARELYRGVPFAEVPAALERMLAAYLRHRTGPGESFHAFCKARDIETLKRIFAEAAAGMLHDRAA